MYTGKKEVNECQMSAQLDNELDILHKEILKDEEMNVNLNSVKRCDRWAQDFSSKFYLTPVGYLCGVYSHSN